MAKLRGQTVQLEVLEPTEPEFVTIRPQLSVAYHGQPCFDLSLCDANFCGLGVAAAADLSLTSKMGLRATVQLSEEPWKFTIGQRHCQLALDSPRCNIRLNAESAATESQRDLLEGSLATLSAQSTWSQLRNQFALSPSFHAGYRRGSLSEDSGHFASAEMLASFKSLGAYPTTTVVHSATGFGIPLQISSHALRLNVCSPAIYSRRLGSLQAASNARDT